MLEQLRFDTLGLNNFVFFVACHGYRGRVDVVAKSLPRCKNIVACPALLYSVIAALPYLETGHACGSVKPWDSATISWIKGFRWSPLRGLSSWLRSPTRKHISSNYFPRATVGGAAIATGEQVPLRRSPTRKQNRPNNVSSHFLKVFKFFLQLKSIYLSFLNCLICYNIQDYFYYYYLYFLVW